MVIGGPSGATRLAPDPGWFCGACGAHNVGARCMGRHCRAKRTCLPAAAAGIVGAAASAAAASPGAAAQAPADAFEITVGMGPGDVADTAGAVASGAAALPGAAALVLADAY